MANVYTNPLVSLAATLSSVFGVSISRYDDEWTMWWKAAKSIGLPVGNDESVDTLRGIVLANWPSNVVASPNPWSNPIAALAGTLSTVFGISISRNDAEYDMWWKAAKSIGMKVGGDESLDTLRVRVILNWPSGGPPPPPASVLAWYAADSLLLSNGNPVATWNDLSGNMNDAVAPNANKPIFTTGAIDSKPALRWSTGDDQLNLPSGVCAGLTEAEVFLVVKVNFDPSGGLSGGLWVFGTDLANDHYPFTNGTVYMGWGSDTRYIVGDPSPTLADWRIVNITSTASHWEMRLDGVSLLNQSPNNVAFVTQPRLGVGVSVGGVALDGYIAEFIMFDGELDSTTRASVNAYLTGKYPSLA